MLPTIASPTLCSQSQPSLLDHGHNSSSLNNNSTAHHNKRFSAPVPAKNYKDLIAHLAATAPQPYGFIPPRPRSRRITPSNANHHGPTSTPTTSTIPNNTQTGTTPTRGRSSSASVVVHKPLAMVSLSEKQLPPTLAINTSLNQTPEPSSEKSPFSTWSFSLRLPSLNPTSSPVTSPTATDSLSWLNLDVSTPPKPLVLEASPESLTSSTSTRLGFWANLKAQYLATASSLKSSSTKDKDASCMEPISPTSATRPASSPVAMTIKMTTASCAAPVAVQSISPAFSRSLLTLPNLAVHNESAYAVSTLEKFNSKQPAKRTDTIALKTFTYNETPVVERPRPVLPFLPLGQVKRRQLHNRQTTGDANNRNLTSADQQGPLKVTSSCPSASKTATVEERPTPRHLATRETRSNSDYLRMMASELRMIRSRKLVSPLKPRGYLPRRRDPFRSVKSSLCESMEMPDFDKYHPLDDLLVGSWSSTTSTDSFLSTTSSDYHTAMDE